MDSIQILTLSMPNCQFCHGLLTALIKAHQEINLYVNISSFALDLEGFILAHIGLLFCQADVETDGGTLGIWICEVKGNF